MAEKDEVCVQCMKRADGRTVSCNWGLVEGIRKQAAALKKEMEDGKEDFMASTYQMSYCDPRCVVGKIGGETYGAGGKCPTISDRRRTIEAHKPPCMPKDLIPEFRPDTHPSVFMSTRFDHKNHSMTSDPCNRCDLGSGQMIHHVKTYVDRSNAPTMKSDY